MREFTEPFPENGFYVVTEKFHTENMDLVPGEIVALARWSDSRYVRIAKIGGHFIWLMNYMEVEYIDLLRKLEKHEVAGLVSDGFKVEFDQLDDIGYLAAVCRHIKQPAVTAF